MSNGQAAADDSNGRSKAYSVNVHAKAQSSNSCSFCWFVLALYPTLNGMPDRDRVTFTAHLQKMHGLRAEIQA